MTARRCHGQSPLGALLACDLGEVGAGWGGHLFFAVRRRKRLDRRSAQEMSSQLRQRIHRVDIEPVDERRLVCVRGGNGGSEEASSGSPDHGSGDGADPAGSPGTPDAMDPSDEEAEAVTATAAAASPTPIRTPTPAPTQTPTATPIPTAVTVTVSGGCEFSPENAMVVRGGTVAFVNVAGHELEITIFPPGEEGDAVGQGIEPGEASAALPIEQRGVSKAVCEGPDDGEFGNMRITAVL